LLTYLLTYFSALEKTTIDNVGLRIDNGRLFQTRDRSMAKDPRERTYALVTPVLGWSTEVTFWQLLDQVCYRSNVGKPVF